jgi:outer membrane immunogenic protein
MTMKLKVIAGAGALVWMSAVSPVLAADIPAAPIVKAPVVVPGQSWYGSFIGVSGGYGWGNQSVEFRPDAFYLPFLITSGSPLSAAASPRGFLAGVTYGSNWQFGSVVLGTDSDFSFSDIKASQTFAGVLGGAPFTSTTTQKLNWFSTTRLRGGFLLSNNWLLYATGGLAGGRGESTSGTTIPVAGGCVTVGICPSGSASKNLWGWALGGGLEYANGPWQFRAEYLHYDLGTLNYTLRDPFFPFNSIGASTRFSGDMVRGAITYRFNWTVWGLLFGTDRL